MMRERHHHVDAWDRHQARDALVRQSRAGEIALDHLEVLAEPIELAQVPLDGKPLVLRHDLLGQAMPVLSARTDPACGQDGIRCACRIDWMMFFRRDRWRTIWLRRVTCRRSAWVGSSAIQTSGRKPLA